jgi:LacI family transcriptional regulator
MPTLKDVARVAGVSTATVSRTLSGDGGDVRPETRQRVLDAARALGHEPNRLPMYLKRRAVNTIGFVVNDIGNPFYPAMARGCEDVLRRAGYSLIMASTDEDPEREAALLQEMAAERLAGIILTPSGEPSEHLRRMIENGTPFVSLDREPGIRVDRVGVDNDAASYEAVQHLLGLGHRRIAVIAGPGTIGAAEERLDGYQRAMREARLRPDPSLVRRGDLREDGGYRRALELFDLPEPPTALFSVNNLTTIGVLRAARQRGISMPDRLSLVGFDDIPTGELLEPPLTAIVQPTYQLGAKAAELLLRRIAEPDAPVTEVVLQASLVIRGSTGRPSTTASPAAV